MTEVDACLVEPYMPNAQLIQAKTYVRDAARWEGRGAYLNKYDSNYAKPQL